MGYDTIYGAQDISDDEIIGVKSTSIKFKNKLKPFVFLCYLITSSIIFWLIKDDLGFNMITFFSLLFLLTLIYQINIFEINKPSTCLQAFKINNLTGLFLFLIFNFI